MHMTSIPFRSSLAVVNFFTLNSPGDEAEAKVGRGRLSLHFSALCWTVG